MPTARFVVTGAPIEAQLTTSLSAQLRDTVALALRLKRRVNDTLHDEELSEKAGNVLLDVAQPGGLPFALFVLLIAVLVVRELLLRLRIQLQVATSAFRRVLRRVVCGGSTGCHDRRYAPRTWARCSGDALTCQRARHGYQVAVAAIRPEAAEN